MFSALLIPLHPTLNKTNAASNLNLPPAKPAIVQQVEQPTPVKAEEVVTPPQPQQPTYQSGSHEDWMTQAGIAPSDFAAVDFIVTHESGWRYWAVNSEGATGLCQALPGVKMASVGPDYLTNPITQLKWCTQYATSRYGGWWAAYNVWVAQRWW